MQDHLSRATCTNWVQGASEGRARGGGGVRPRAAAKVQVATCPLTRLLTRLLTWLLLLGGCGRPLGELEEAVLKGADVAASCFHPEREKCGGGKK